MAVFTDARISAMRQALDEVFAADKSAKNADFAANFVAGGETLTIAVHQGTGEVSVGSSGAPDFGFEGHPDDWNTYFTTRPASHSSLVAMLMAADVSAGLVASSLTSSGDMEALFANLPIYNRIIEAATEGGTK